ncbi:protein neprosin-like [Gastrolobium bilobum]|uniref:protein neprosin-like n=1 Tax=Gastrolobium bilobum TaxID=150636 RepID=UPI002AB09980|nr:protein neprosin-like [Gastrolobium bilobum]XP_061376670.1 protein neprosin-like [Gastrolobium bilobum]
MDMAVDVFPRTKSKSRNRKFCFVDGRRQHKCEQTQTRKQQSFSNMDFRWCLSTPIISLLVHFLLVASSVCPVYSSQMGTHQISNQTFRPEEEFHKLKTIRIRLQQINKPALKTIQSPDGDILDCVVSHKQPAFDHPLLKGQKPMDPPERPRGHKEMGDFSENFQLWSLSGESCPEGTIPIRRTTKQDMLRASSISSFGRKIIRRVRRDTSGDGHEHAVGYVTGDQYYGAKASINVWAPLVENQYEFSLSQMWVISGSFGDDLNTIEAGWQVSPELYGDSYPRFFTYWTTDAYQATGCYNLLCSGFVQTNSKIAIGAAISPTSSYNGGQFDISLLIWKDPKHGNWWLEFGSGVLVGYWPSFLFTHLGDHASMVQFGGEIVNSMSSGSHTSTQMGSGHFAGEGFAKASYFRNLQVVDWDNNLIPLSNLRVLADHPNCYDIQGGVNNAWGNYFYYGGPGKNVKCP